MGWKLFLRVRENDTYLPLSETTPAHTSPLCCKAKLVNLHYSQSQSWAPFSILYPSLRVIKNAGLVSDPTLKEGGKHINIKVIMASWLTDN